MNKFVELASPKLIKIQTDFPSGSKQQRLGSLRGIVPLPPARPHQKTYQAIRRCHSYGMKSTSRAVLSRMQITLHATRQPPHGASRLMQALSAWSVRRTLSRQYSDASVYGHTTTASARYEYTPPLLPPVHAAMMIILPIHFNDPLPQETQEKLTRHPQQ